MPDYPNGIELGDSEDIIIVNSFAKTYSFNLPDESVAEIDSATDTITGDK